MQGGGNKRWDKGGLHGSANGCKGVVARGEIGEDSAEESKKEMKQKKRREPYCSDNMIIHNN